jgi:NOL1/NOP2/sun family putative RNA methylase
VTETVPLPPLFLERMRRFLGDEFPAFLAALDEEPVGGLRVNTLKLPAEEFEKISPFPLGGRIPWAPDAFLLPPGEASFGIHPYHLAGLYYLQDPSAMAPATLLGPQPGERVLDLAASPGGKTTALAALMQGRGLLVANEIKDKRLGHLAMNVERWGAGNVVITNEAPERLADHFGPFFDRVLVDAPCSGEGMFRKDMSARRDWSPEMVTGCAVRQGNILRVAAKLVRPGGYLLYSTCTFAPEEDEAVVNGLLRGFTDGNGLEQFEVVELPRLEGFMPGRPDWMESTKGTKGAKELEGAVRLFPHLVTGEGHFACLLRRLSTDGEADKRTKTQNWPGQMDAPGRAQLQDWKVFREDVLNADFPQERMFVRGERLYLVPEGMPDFGRLWVAHPGVWLGTFKTGRFEPAHPLALSLCPGGARRTLDLAAGSRELSAYLRGETLPSAGEPGWLLVTVDAPIRGGFARWPLGWGKRVQGVVKNHYPRGWMI